MAVSHTTSVPLRAQAFEVTSGTEWTEIARRSEASATARCSRPTTTSVPGAIAESSGHRPVDVAPIAAMTAAAAATTELRVGCRVFNVDLHHPVVLAKELATLDLLSDGRLEVGLGAGWVAAEYEGLDVTMDRPGVRIARLGEVVELMKAHWSGEEVAVDGTYVHAHGFTGLPRPVQQPHPPILIGGGRERILTLAGRLADIVSFNYDNSVRPPRGGQRGQRRRRRDGSEGGVGPGRRRRPLRRHRARDRRLLRGRRRPPRTSWSRRWPSGSGSTSRPSTTTPTPCSAASTRSATPCASGASGTASPTSRSPQRNMDDFAPVVARMAGT